MFGFYLSAYWNTLTQCCLIKSRRIGRHSHMNQCQVILSQSASVYVFRNAEMSTEASEKRLNFL